MALVPPVNRSFMDRSQRFSQGALQARSAMRPNVKFDPPGKTAGGAISSSAGMGMAGYMVGGMVEGSKTGSAWGAGIGAGLGLAAYLLS
jgi:hypothetical protein